MTEPLPFTPREAIGVLATELKDELRRLEESTDSVEVLHAIGGTTALVARLGQVAFGLGPERMRDGDFPEFAQAVVRRLRKAPLAFVAVAGPYCDRIEAALARLAAER